MFNHDLIVSREENRATGRTKWQDDAGGSKDVMEGHCGRGNTLGFDSTCSTRNQRVSRLSTAQISRYSRVPHASTEKRHAEYFAAPRTFTPTRTYPTGPRAYLQPSCKMARCKKLGVSFRVIRGIKQRMKPSKTGTSKARQVLQSAYAARLRAPSQMHHTQQETFSETTDKRRRKKCLTGVSPR